MENNDQIARSLEAIKSNGLISEYLVSWNGQGGLLRPTVTVWGDIGVKVENVRCQIAETLFGLVDEHRITVLAD